MTLPAIFLGLSVTASLLRLMSPLQALILCTPIMIDVGGDSALNGSVADFWIGVLFFQAITDRRFRNELLGHLVPWLLLVVPYCIGGYLIWDFLLDGGVLEGRWLIDSAKIVVVITTAATTFTCFRFSRSELEKLSATWAATSVAVAGLALFQVLALGEVRATSSFNDPNLLGAYLTISLGIASTLQNKALGVIAAASSCAGIAATGSRGALAAALVLILLMLLTAPIRLSYRIGLVFILATGGRALWPRLETLAPVQRLESSVGVATQDIRAAIWSFYLRNFQTLPVFGAGPGQSANAAGEYVGFGGPVEAHNTYLQILADWGIAGTLLLTLPVIRMLLRSTTIQELLANRRIVYVTAAVSVSSLTISLHNSRMVVVALALAVAHTVQRRRAHDPVDIGHDCGRAPMIPHRRDAGRSRSDRKGFHQTRRRTFGLSA